MSPEPARRLRIAAIEPYDALSHRAFLEGLRDHSRHRIEILSLPARFWKWRMRTAAIHFAHELQEHGPFDAYLASDYLSLAELLGILPPPARDAPAWLYFHENQLTYPLQTGERRDHHFAMTHLTSILAARGALFNSDYHRAAFQTALEALLARVPDIDTQAAMETVRRRSSVLPLGTDLLAGSPRGGAELAPVILWSHRWEYDKAPSALLRAVLELERRGVHFRLRLLGQRFQRTPPELDRLRTVLGPRLEDLGFLEERGEYLAALASSHVVLSTARHEFFGLGTLEALRTGLLPVLPADLAYPELLPPDAHRSPFLYERDRGPVEALVEALNLVRSGGAERLRKAIVGHTERFAWRTLAPVYDELLAGGAWKPGSKRPSASAPRGDRSGRGPGNDPGANGRRRERV